MSRILFVAGSERGHVNPCIGPALHLLQRGHTVAFYSPNDISEQLKRAGFGISFSAKPALPPQAVNVGKYFAEHIKDAEWLKHFLKKVYLDRVKSQVNELKNAVADFEPDLLACDPKLYEGPIVAETEKLPWASLSPSLTLVSPDYMKTDLGKCVKWFFRDRTELFDSYGVKAKFRFTDCLSPHLNLSFTTDRFTGATGITDVWQVGPSLVPGDRGDECDFPWEKINDSLPLIYVFLGGRTFYQPQILRNIFAAVTDRQIQLVCAAGPLAGSVSLGDLPPNVIVVSQAPQLSLLRAASAHISHGGAASVMESIALGVPMLVTPFFDDQAHQAYFIDKSGVGLRSDLSRLDPEECWQEIQSVLHSPRLKDVIESARLSYRQSDGALESARLIERLT